MIADFVIRWYRRNPQSISCQSNRYLCKFVSANIIRKAETRWAINSLEYCNKYRRLDISFSFCVLRALYAFLHLQIFLIICTETIVPVEASKIPLSLYKKFLWQEIVVVMRSSLFKNVWRTGYIESLTVRFICGYRLLSYPTNLFKIMN